MLSTIWPVLRYCGTTKYYVCNLMEGRMVGKPTRVTILQRIDIKTKNRKEVQIVDSNETFMQQDCTVVLKNYGHWTAAENKSAPVNKLTLKMVENKVWQQQLKTLKTTKTSHSQRKQTSAIMNAVSLSMKTNICHHERCFTDLIVSLLLYGRQSEPSTVYLPKYDEPRLTLLTTLNRQTDRQRNITHTGWRKKKRGHRPSYLIANITKTS